MPFIDKTKPVIVTGGTGYIASWIINFLLEDGYPVKTSVRDKSNQKKVSHLNDLSKKYPGKLELFEADLLDEKAFTEPVKGAELVIHTASPFKVQGVKAPKAELIDPALKGTRHVLQAVNESKSVKRVVLTSSAAAIYGDSSDIWDTENNVFTEDHWNSTSSLQHQPYSYSKMVAEKEAWKLNKEQNDWDLVVMNPGFVMGPSLTKSSGSESLVIIDQIVSGKLKMGVPKLEYGVVDVRDVAKAHIVGGTKKEASGRHILVNKTMDFMEMVNFIKDHVSKPGKLPSRFLPKFLLYLFGPFQGFSWRFIRNNVGISIQFDNSRSVKELGIKYTNPDFTFRDQMEQMKKDGLIT